MSIQEQIATELRRRAQLLPGLIAEWKKQTDANIHGMGIHQSQVRAVGRMFDEFMARQDALAKDLDPDKVKDMSAQDFRRIRQEFEQELTGSHSIMAAFRYIFAQRNDSADSKRMIDAADLIAADCYLPCIALANKWNKQPAENYREPPLIYLNAKLSPAAITRQHYFGLIGLELYGSLEQQLPISIISLSFHDVAAFWTFCSIYHEAGHLLDQDLGLLDELQAVAKERLKGSANKDVWSEWWIAEMIADAFGIMLGGAGFAYSLMSMLSKTESIVTGPTTDTHPSPYVRIYLICELLRGLREADLNNIADEIEQNWKRTYGEPSPKWDSYVKESKEIADVLLNTKLEKLGQKCLLDFVKHPNDAENAANKAADHALVLSLERYLRIGYQRPNPKTFPRRLVPAAAQLAASRVTSNFADVYAGIQERALTFLAGIPHKKFLAGSGMSAKKHEKFLDEFIRNMDFSELHIDGAALQTANET